jgi:hypothetical protein
MHVFTRTSNWCSAISAAPPARLCLLQDKTCVTQVMLVFRPHACCIGDGRWFEAQLYLARG